MAENIPDLTIYREVLNFDETTFEGLRKEIQRQGISEDHIRMMGRVSCRAVILSPGDTRSLMRHFEIDASESLIEELGDYLEVHMPESSDKQTTTSTYPFAEHTPLGRTNTRLFTVGILSPVIREERRQAKILTAEFLGLEQEDTDAVWPDWNYMGEVWVARLSAPLAVKAMRDALGSRPDLLPSTIDFSPITIDSDT